MTRTGLSGYLLQAAGSLALAITMAAGAQAAEVKKLAIMVPEQGTDYGWNQQGVDAAKAVAEKYGLEFMPAEGLGYGDVRPTLRELADDGASLIIAHASLQHGRARNRRGKERSRRDRRQSEGAEARPHHRLHAERP
jgi:simple sugar transport system substrate-binding protein